MSNRSFDLAIAKVLCEKAVVQHYKGGTYGEIEAMRHALEHTLVAACVEVRQVREERDDAYSALASLCDFINTEAREYGVSEQAEDYEHPSGEPMKRVVRAIVDKFRGSK